MDKLSIETRNVEEILIFDLKGILDVNSKDMLIEKFKKQYDKNFSKFLINFQLISRIDSSGVNSIIELYDITEKDNKEIIIYNLCPHVDKMMRLAQLHRFITIKNNETEAVV